MTDQQFTDFFANEAIAHHLGGGVAPHALFTGGVLAKIITALRAAGVTWGSIFQFIGAIVAIMSNGGSGGLSAILAAVFALFGKTPPATLP